MKKLLPLLLTIAFLFSASCAEEAAPPSFFWERDGVNHWQLDASGAVINQGAHDTSDGWLCSICKCEILDWGDGAFDVIDYDEYGHILRYTSFVDGEKTYDSVHVITCSEDGVLLSDKEYLDGVLAAESVYAVSANGGSQPATMTTWNDDGTTSVNEYDEHGNCVRSVIYAEDGAIICESLSEFALSDSGYYYECKTTSRFDSGETFITENNQYGDHTRVLNTHANGTVWSDAVYEYEYKDGVKAWRKQYSFGKLSWEESYNEEGSCIQAIEYLEDSSKIIYLFNDQGDSTSSTTYAADGSVVSVTTYEHIYTEEMVQQEIRVYTDGVLTMTTRFHLDEEIGFAGSTETTYHADGTQTVYEYNNFLELVSTTLYAADGSIISVTTAEEAF